MSYLTSQRTSVFKQASSKQKLCYNLKLNTQSKLLQFLRSLHHTKHNYNYLGRYPDYVMRPFGRMNRQPNSGRKIEVKEAEFCQEPLRLGLLGWQSAQPLADADQGFDELLLRWQPRGATGTWKARTMVCLIDSKNFNIQSRSKWYESCIRLNAPNVLNAMNMLILAHAAMQRTLWSPSVKFYKFTWRTNENSRILIKLDKTPNPWHLSNNTKCEGTRLSW